MLEISVPYGLGDFDGTVMCKKASELQRERDKPLELP